MPEQAPALIPVKSSNISAAAYSAATRTLYVKFSRGDVYKYENVPVEVYKAFMLAKSKGAFFAKHIKDRYEAEPL